MQVRDHDGVHVHVVDALAQLREHAVAAVHQDHGVVLLDQVAGAGAAGVLPGRRLAEHGEPHERTLTGALRRSAAETRRPRWSARSGRRRRAGARARGRARPGGRSCRLVEVERAEHVLVEVAVLAAGGLRLRHRTSTQQPPDRGSRHPPFSGLCRVVRGRPASSAFFRGANFGEVLCSDSWSSSPVAPDTSEVACFAASRRRAGPCARWPGDPSSLPEVEAVRGDLLTGPGLEEALDGCSTAYYLVHSMEPRDERRLRRPRPPHGRGLRRGGGARRGRADRLPRRHRAAEHAAVAAPRLPPRGRGDPARRRARLDRAAGLDRDRRRLVVVPAPRPARGAAAGAADAALAQEPHRSRSTSAT